MDRRGPLPKLALLAPALLAVLAGCGRSCKDDHPYVPYSVGNVPDAALPDADEVEAAAPEPPRGGVEPALTAPPNTTTWKLEGIELVAPSGRELLAALVRDFDGDGKNDALAIVRALPGEGAKADSATYEIVHYAGGASSPSARTVATAPPARAEGCAPVVRLERVGPRSAFAELGASCPRGAASRTLYVVRLSKEPAVAFDAVLTDPPAAPKLSVEADGADRDHDGIDDIALRVAIEGGGPPFEPGPKLSAKLAFFDRPAGASRDPDEPDASLRAIAGQAAARAKGKDRASVPVLVQQMRALYRAMCDEGGAPRLAQLHGGGAVSCGASRPLEDAGLAEVRALALGGDAVRAFAAAAVAQLAPATKTAAKATELESLLAQVAPVVQASRARTLGSVVDAPRGRHPEWGPVAFDGAQVLVRGGGKVVRVDPETGIEEPTEMLPWPTQVLSPDGRSRWLEAYHACEGVALRSTFAPTGDGDLRDVLLPIAPRLGARCAGARGEAASTLPIAWGDGGLEAIVAGQPLLVKPEAGQASALASPLEQAPPLGSPRSPQGRALAVPTSRGVLVVRDRAALYKAAELEPYAELRGCTVSDDASRVACVRRGRVVVATFER